MENNSAIDINAPLSISTKEFAYKKAIGFGITSVFFIVIVMMIAFIKFSKMIFGNPLIFLAISSLTALSIAYYFYTILKLSSTEIALQKLEESYSYDDALEKIDGYLITTEINDFLGGIENNPTYGKALGKSLIYNISNLSNTLRYLGQALLAIGLIGTLWGIAIPFMNLDTLGEIKEKFNIFSDSLSLILGSSLMGIFAYAIIQIFEWRFNHFTQSLMLFIRNVFTQRLKECSKINNNSSPIYVKEDGKLHQKLSEINGTISDLKNNVPHKDENIMIEKLKDAIISIFKPQFEKINTLPENLSNDATIEINKKLENIVLILERQDLGWRESLQQVTKDILSNEKPHSVEGIHLELKETVKEIETQISKLHQEAQKIDLGVKSLHQSQHIHRHDISNLKNMLSDELNHIKIERNKPIMFMPVTETEKNTNN